VIAILLQHPARKRVAVDSHILLIHLRDICPDNSGQCNDGTIAVKGNRGGIPQSFQENPKSAIPVPW
jgi:hypothetical protein